MWVLRDSFGLQNPITFGGQHTLLDASNRHMCDWKRVKCQYPDRGIATDPHVDFLLMERFPRKSAACSLQ